MEKIERLKSTRIFGDLTDDELHAVGRVSMEKIYPSDSVLIHEGRKSEGLFIIENGRVKIVKGSANDPLKSNNVIAELGEGDHFGEMSLIDGAPASASVVAIMPTICHMVKFNDYIKLMNDNISIGYKLYRFYTKSLVQRLRKTDEYLHREMSKNDKNKLDRQLFSRD